MGRGIVEGEGWQPSRFLLASQNLVVMERTVSSECGVGYKSVWPKRSPQICSSLTDPRRSKNGLGEGEGVRYTVRRSGDRGATTGRGGTVLLSWSIRLDLEEEDTEMGLSGPSATAGSGGKLG